MLKSLLLVVEDNPHVLLNLQVSLECNNYEVIAVTNGLEALEALSKLDRPPDLILSDITMPKMDGYDFFKNISENPLWSKIPFIFLTALTSPTNIRFGKMLGVDDYILKPFKEEDLLASIAGKITRSKNTESINRKVEELLVDFKIETLPSLAETEKHSVTLLYVKWDDKLGPTLELQYPVESKLPISLDKLAYQLFNGVSSIYGQDKIRDAQGILLKIENIQRVGYSYFDAIQETGTRGGELPFMLAVITPSLNYLDSLRLKKVLSELSLKIKQGESWKIKDYWERISEVLTTPIM